MVKQNQSAARFPARTHTHTRDTTLANLNANAVQQPQAYALVSTWNDTLTVPLRVEVQRQLAKEVDDLLRAGRINLSVLRAALDDWATRGRTPAFLKHCYDDAATTARAAQTPTSTPDVPGSRVYGRASSGSARADKALGFLAPGDPFLAEFTSGAAAALPQPEFRVIEGGRAG